MSVPPEPLAAGFEPPTREAWLALVAKVLKGDDYNERLVGRTIGGLTIEPLYVRQAGPSATFPSRAAGGAWRICQRHSDPDPQRANVAVRADVEGGVDAIELTIAASGQAGLPSQGDAIAVALEATGRSTAIALNARENTLDAAGAVLAFWRQRGLSEEACCGAFNFDPLGVLAATGTLIDPPDRAALIAAKFAADCGRMPAVTALLADGRPYHEAGASETQELAATLATLLAYLRACEDDGLAPEAALGKIAVALAADADLFLTLAKLRTARRLLERVAAGCAAASAVLPLWVTTSQRMMARRDPWVNILRTTIACAGATFGGASAITVLPFTQAIGLPDAFARRVARNTGLVLREESALARVHDPGRGAWAVEALTDELAARAWALFQEIEQRGGLAQVLLDGTLQQQIGEVATQRARELVSGKMELTGVSSFPWPKEPAVATEPYPPAPPLLKGAVAAPALPPQRLAAPFEALRDAADAYAHASGRGPRAFLAGLGGLAANAECANRLRNFLAVGGIEAIASEGIASAVQIPAAFAASATPLACLCGSPEADPQLVAAVAALKGAGARRIVVAGSAPALDAPLRTAGAHWLLDREGDALAVLTDLHAALGITGAHPAGSLT